MGSIGDRFENGQDFRQDAVDCLVGSFRDLGAEPAAGDARRPSGFEQPGGGRQQPHGGGIPRTFPLDSQKLDSIGEFRPDHGLTGRFGAPAKRSSGWASACNDRDGVAFCAAFAELDKVSSRLAERPIEIDSGAENPIDEAMQAVTAKKLRAGRRPPRSPARSSCSAGGRTGEKTLRPGQPALSATWSGCGRHRTGRAGRATPRRSRRP